MGQSQSYDLRNPELDEKNKDPVRGVRRVSKEHQTESNYSAETSDGFDFREDELRDRIRREQLIKREAELESMRIRQHESREPIIDAYRQSPSSTLQPASYKEFNHYDTLKHSPRSDSAPQFTLTRRAEVNGGVRQPMPFAPPDPHHNDTTAVVIPVSREPASPDGYPRRTSQFSGRLSPLPRHREVDAHPMPRYIPPMSTRQTPPPSGTYSKTTTVQTMTYYSRGAPRYDQVPTEPIEAPPTAKSAPSTYSRATSRAPTYDEVPIRVTQPLPLEKEVQKVPLECHVAPTVYPAYEPKAPHYDEVPTMTHQAYGPISEPKAHSPRPYVPAVHPMVHETLPLEKEVREVPLDRHVAPREHPAYRPRPSEPVAQKPDHSAYGPKHEPKESEAHRPNHSPVHSVAHEVLPLQAEVPPSQLDRHVAPRVHPAYEPKPIGPNEEPTVTHHEAEPIRNEHIVELHAEKRMLVGLEEPPEHVTYVTVIHDFPTYATSSRATSPLSPPQTIAMEPLHRNPEIGRHPILAPPTQTSYEGVVDRHRLQSIDNRPNLLRNQETQYSRRQSEDVTAPPSRILEQQKRCHVENCTHVEINDTPVVARRRISQDVRENKTQSRLTIFVDEQEMENVVALAKDEDVGPMTSGSRRCFEEKLYYHSYMPTLSLGRRPVVGFYDKLH